MEGDPSGGGGEEWTSVDKKSKRRNKADIHPAKEESPADGWQQVGTKEKKRSESHRQDRGGHRGEDRRGGERRGGERGGGGGGYGKPPARGGSTHRGGGTLPRKYSSREAGSDKHVPSRNTPSPAPQTTVLTSASQNTAPSKPTWASAFASGGAPPVKTTDVKPDITPTGSVVPKVENDRRPEGTTKFEPEARKSSWASTVVQKQDSTLKDTPVPITPLEPAATPVETDVPLSAEVSEVIKVETIASKDDTVKPIVQALVSNVDADIEKITDDIKGVQVSEEPDEVTQVKDRTDQEKAVTFNVNSLVNGDITEVVAEQGDDNATDETGGTTSPSSQGSPYKQYDRDFLLQLQKTPLSLQKPEKLPDLEIVLSSSLRPSASAPQLGDTPNEYVHTLGRGMPTKRDSRRKDLPKKVISISREPVVLHIAENAWMPGAKNKAVAEDDEIEVLGKRVRSILNKLTPQKFDKLVTQFKELVIDTEEKLVKCTDLVFEKAVDEPAFSVAYAKMCYELSMKNVPRSKNPSEVVNFRAMLLNMCQKEFEKDYLSESVRKQYELDIAKASGDDEKKVIRDNFDQLELKQRRRSLGNIRFIGELYRLEMLKSTIMHSIIRKLLTATDEESLESLCHFLTTVGDKLEKVTKEQVPVNLPVNYFEEYFKKISELVADKKVSSRIRFLMQDVVDLRDNNWVKRREVTGPKTIEQIHKEAKIEALKIQLADQSPMAPVSRRSEDRRRSRMESPRGPPQGEEVWNNVPCKPAKMIEKVDTTKLKFSKQDANSIKLGPGSKGMSWGRGSGMAGGRVSLQEKAPVIVSSNRFQLFDEEETTMPPPTTTYSGRASEPVRRSHDRSLSRGSGGGRSRGEFYRSSSRDQALEKLSRVHLNGPAGLDEDMLEKKSKPCLEEFLHNCDFTETIKCICEIFNPSNVDFLVDFCVREVLEKSAKDQKLVGELLNLLLKENCLDIDKLAQGYRKVLEYASDYLIDIPKFWDCMAEIISPVVVENLSLDSLFRICFQVLEDRALRLEFAKAVVRSSKKLNLDSIAKQLDEKKPQLDQIFGEDVTLLLETTPEGLAAPSLTNGFKESKENLFSRLTKIFNRGQDVDNELLCVELEISDISIDNVTVRTLVGAVMENVIDGAGVPGNEIFLNEDKLKDRVKILKKYLDSRKERELSALYAIQSLVHKLEHPNKLLHSILEKLYDHEVISEDAIFEWEQDTETDEQEGKGVALKSCNQFLVWLREAEAEDDEEKEKVQFEV